LDRRLSPRHQHAAKLLLARPRYATSRSVRTAALWADRCHAAASGPQPTRPPRCTALPVGLSTPSPIPWGLHCARVASAWGIFVHLPASGSRLQMWDHYTFTADVEFPAARAASIRCCATAAALFLPLTTWFRSRSMAWLRHPAHPIRRRTGTRQPSRGGPRGPSSMGNTIDRVFVPRPFTACVSRQSTTLSVDDDLRQRLESAPPPNSRPFQIGPVTASCRSGWRNFEERRTEPSPTPPRSFSVYPEHSDFSAHDARSLSRGGGSPHPAPVWTPPPLGAERVGGRAQTWLSTMRGFLNGDDAHKYLLGPRRKSCRRQPAHLFEARALPVPIRNILCHRWQPTCWRSPALRKCLLQSASRLHRTAARGCLTHGPDGLRSRLARPRRLRRRYDPGAPGKLISFCNTAHSEGGGHTPVHYAGRLTTIHLSAGQTLCACVPDTFSRDGLTNSPGAPGMNLYRRTQRNLRFSLPCFWTLVFFPVVRSAKRRSLIPEQIEWTWEVRPPHFRPKACQNVLLLGPISLVHATTFPEVTKDLARRGPTSTLWQLSTLHRRSAGCPGEIRAFRHPWEHVTFFAVVHFNNGMHGWPYTRSRVQSGFLPEFHETPCAHLVVAG